MPDVQKISIALTGEQIGALKAAVETGEYATTSEIVREAIRDWQFKRALRQEDLNRLRQMCSLFGAEIESLTRSRILNIDLGSLPSGSYRKLDPDEELPLFLKSLGL